MSAATRLSAGDKTAVLVEALPYIRRFWGKVVVVKYGGAAMSSGERSPTAHQPPPSRPRSPSGGPPTLTGGADAASELASFAADVVLMRSVGMRPVVVHGGGPQIGALMRRLGKVPEFRDGLRVTDAETLDIARMVLVGKVNRDLVDAINVHAPIAVGLSGEDATLITAAARDPGLGFVGDVARVDPSIVERLLSQELIPVVATIGADVAGQAYNINADVAAGALAEALGAEKLVYLTDVEGLRRDVADPASLVPAVTADELEALLADGSVGEGMIPKVTSCLRAVRGGVASAHILDGRAPHALLLEIFTREGAGTMVTR